MDRVSGHSTPGEISLSSRVHLTGVNRAPEWKDDFDNARQERKLEAVACTPSVRLGMSPTPRRQTPMYAPRCPFHNPVERFCAYLFDYLVRLEQERWGDREAQDLGSLEVDDQLEFHGLFHR
jgi:hypothetical protein